MSGFEILLYLLLILFLMALAGYSCKNRVKIIGEEKKPQKEENVEVKQPQIVEAQNNKTEIENDDNPADDLKEIKGIGPKIEKLLNDMGICRFEQIAKWTKEDIEKIEKFLKFRGRIERENWIEQAKLLAKGESTEFSQRVKRGEVQGY